MTYVALIDATHHHTDARPDRVVAGLTLLERAVRLAAVKDCTHAVVAASDEWLTEVERLVADIDFGISLEVRAVESDALGPLLAEVEADIEEHLAVNDGVLMVRSTTVYDRGLIHACEADSVGTARTDADGITDVLEVPAEQWPSVAEASRQSGARDVGQLVDALESRGIGVDVAQTPDKWQLRVDDDASADQAAERLYNSCRKDADGIVSRYLNRNISLAISRTLAASGVKPNHISVVTFSLGVLAAVFAGIGGYVWFVLAGITYQLNSIVDGVDGELARVKYEFSLLGEWLDTISDDTKDVLFYIGLGLGAYKTWDFPIEGFGPEGWLWLGGIAVVGKVVAMIAYYTWLIAHNRGDLLAFQWSFEDEEEEPGRLAQLLSNFKYVTKQDFIIFGAMWMAIVGALPYFLFFIAPGQLFVAASVVIQRLQAPS